MKTVTYGIPSWSFKTFRARKNYRCAQCDGVIPSGTKYLRHVVRLGPKKGSDPLQNVHVHLDCGAPWYQPDMPKRLYHVGKLPGRTPPPSVYNGEHGFLKPGVALNTKAIGVLQWTLPHTMAQKIAFTPNKELALSAISEIEHSLMIVATALITVCGHQKKSMQLSHLINEISRYCDHVPPVLTNE